MKLVVQTFYSFNLLKDSLRLGKYCNLPIVQGPSSSNVRDIESGDKVHHVETETELGYQKMEGNQPEIVFRKNSDVNRVTERDLYFYISKAKCDDDTILSNRLNSVPQLFLVVS